ncbi:MAG: hypothetical protein LQ342_003423 [Letrouitia transgressa]|nr:MAG: hypothetical protein LQ342_003423 [Letrouitia transgressa]
MPLPKHEYLSDVWKDGIFDGKVVFCTGGGGTICSAQVRALVHLGANACIVGRNVKRTESMARDIATARTGAKVLGIGAIDVRKFESLEAAVDRCVKELGGIDFVIAGAAGNFLASISQLSPNAFKSVIDIDVLGSFNTLKATLPSLLSSAKKSPTGGRILFISATLHYTTPPLQSHVSTAKSAIDTLSASAAVEYGPRGLTANVLAPGPIAATEGMQRLARPQDLAASARSVPLGRHGTVRDIADATVWVLGPGCGDFINGAVVVVDGGAWRTHSANAAAGGGSRYPDFLLGAGEAVTGVKGSKTEQGTERGSKL